MFTRAGFNARSGTITLIRARVSVREYPYTTYARLLAWECGDFCWYAKGKFLVWAEQAHIANVLHMPFPFRDRNLPQSRLPA